MKESWLQLIAYDMTPEAKVHIYCWAMGVCTCGKARKREDNEATRPQGSQGEGTEN